MWTNISDRSHSLVLIIALWLTYTRQFFGLPILLHQIQHRFLARQRFIIKKASLRISQQLLKECLNNCWRHYLGIIPRMSIHWINGILLILYTFISHTWKSCLPYVLSLVVCNRLKESSFADTKVDNTKTSKRVMGYKKVKFRIIT